VSSWKTLEAVSPQKTFIESKRSPDNIVWAFVIFDSPLEEYSDLGRREVDILPLLNKEGI